MQQNFSIRLYRVKKYLEITDMRVFNGESYCASVEWGAGISYSDFSKF
jgi:hypothetical protein